MANKELTAIDVYSGVGGWALGLKMAGIKVIASYDHSVSANETNEKNNGHNPIALDVRKLRLECLPKGVDVVVGSPPCTQFSYSNKGGGGDIADGLRDIVKFLKIVDYLRPKFWAMENVPRVAEILKKEVQPRGKLYRFRHLGMVVEIFDMEDFGLPQRRRRCIAGNFDFGLLHSYAGLAKKRTLGDVVNALSLSPIEDPIYGLKLPVDALCDHIVEDYLDGEETRINRAAKVNHPVYNKMKFPDQLDRAVRTVTATCTRVSRESIVIRAPDNPRRFRRLTLRERASLQGFPITFQFYSNNYSTKMKMIGNAVPPLFSFFVGHAIRGATAKSLPALSHAVKKFRAPAAAPAATPAQSKGQQYPKKRTFRFAIPSLRLPSGVRFELGNSFPAKRTLWKMTFVFGNSKSIHKLRMDRQLFEDIMEEIRQVVSAEYANKVGVLARELRAFVVKIDEKTMQLVWSRRQTGFHPFELVDRIDDCAGALLEIFKPHQAELALVIDQIVNEQYGSGAKKLAGRAKLSRNAGLITAGLLVGSVVNHALVTKRPKGVAASV